jgi:hypothetical protein
MASFPSTDAGSAFVVQADGLTIYYAGDHALWAEGQRMDYEESLRQAKATAPRLIASVEIDGSCGPHRIVSGGCSPPRHEALQLLDPVLHDDDARRRRRTIDAALFDHQEPLAVW